MNERNHHLHKATPSGLREVAASSNREKHRKSSKMRKQINRFQMKKSDTTSEKELMIIDISNLPNK